MWVVNDEVLLRSYCVSSLAYLHHNFYLINFNSNTNNFIYLQFVKYQYFDLPVLSPLALSKYSHHFRLLTLHYKHLLELFQQQLYFQYLSDTSEKFPKKTKTKKLLYIILYFKIPCLTALSVITL